MRMGGLARRDSPERTSTNGSVSGFEKGLAAAPAVAGSGDPATTLFRPATTLLGEPATTLDGACQSFEGRMALLVKAARRASSALKLSQDDPLWACGGS